jgi:hypothetical protein
MRYGLLALLSFGLIMAMAGPVAAAACEEQLDIETGLERADSVFVARIISVSDGGAAAVAAVEAVWKGPDLEQTVNLTGGDGDDKVSGRTRVHLVGQRYLVVAAWSRHSFNDDLCTASRLYSGSATEISPAYQAAVGTDEARLPLAAEPVADGSGQGPSPRTAVLGGLVLLLLVIVVFLVRRSIAFKPELGERDLVLHQATAKEESPRRPRRRLAGWISGRFSRTGRDQVARLKAERRAEATREPAPKE